MAGGKGTRLWPESTGKRPKQYLSIFDEETLIEKTVSRLEGLIATDDRYVVTVEEQEAIAKECLGEKVPAENYIYEPNGRNTAPCIYLSLLKLLQDDKRNPADVVAILPSDHIILNKDGFQNTLKIAFDLSVRMKSIVTIGIRPNFPHTGFGYIKSDEEIERGSFVVESFKEKPDLETAKEYLASGNYLWNAGMFVGQISTLLEEFAKHCPSYIDSENAINDAIKSGSGLEKAYDQLEAISIDYAIMEKSDRINVVEAQFDWNDLGSWDAMESVIEAKDNNTHVRTKDVKQINSKGNIVFAPNQHVGLVDVDDLIIISNEKVLTILKKSSSQKIKELVSEFKGTDLV